ncbi:cytochrome-c oxidase [Robbsia sp. KACC 23696]|uniref:cytochrome o ubiquinol oxidase subunit IV n=1 Tax=Robbsia sp. KACC 23696 TaxID=3149231 RepID=UPI00325ADC3A
MKNGAEAEQQERTELRTYTWGAGIALVFTLAAFAPWQRLGVAHLSRLGIIGAVALAQVIVHFRCFLHIGFHRKREDLQLILFSALLLTIMVGGTIWIMGSLAERM